MAKKEAAEKKEYERLEAERREAIKKEYEHIEAVKKEAERIKIQMIREEQERKAMEVAKQLELDQLELREAKRRHNYIEQVYNYARDNHVAELRNALNQKGVCRDWYIDPLTGFNAVHVAMRGDHVACVAALLEKDAPFDEKADSNGYTPLHYAARYGFEKIVHMLLEKNADINIKNHESFTACHFAAKFDHPNIVSVLAESGADVFSKAKDGLTVANVATSNVMKKCAKYLSTPFVPKNKVFSKEDVWKFAFKKDIENLKLALKYGNISHQLVY